MDKSLLGDLDSLPEEDKVRMSAMIEQLQIRDRVLSPPRFLALCRSTWNLRNGLYRS